MKLSDFPAVTAMSRFSWAKMIGRWSNLPDSGEKDLLCGFLALVIDDEGRDGVDLFADSFFAPGAGFYAYCETLNVDPVFLMEQVQRAEEKESVFCQLRAEREIRHAIGRRRC
jgi:hypothetical protein